MLVYSLEESECMSGFQTMCPNPMLVTHALAGADLWCVAGICQSQRCFPCCDVFLKPYVFQKPFSSVTNLWQNCGATWFEMCLGPFCQCDVVWDFLQSLCLSIHTQTWNLQSRVHEFSDIMQCWSSVVSVLSNVKRKTSCLSSVHVHVSFCDGIFTSQVRWVGGCMCYESTGLWIFPR